MNQMKLNCCIVEDDSIALRYLISLLRRWELESRCQLQITSAASREEFLLLNSQDFDVIFLDIILDKTKDRADGVEIAQKLRSVAYHGELIFLTNFQEFVFEGYPVRALDYLLKPAKYEKICHYMDLILKKHDSLRFRCHYRNTSLNIAYSDIFHFTSSNHSTNLVTAEKLYPLPRSLGEIAKSLPSHFAQCHRTVIVNLQQVESLTSQSILLTNGEHLPIGKSHLNHIRRDFMAFLTDRRML